VLVELPGSPFHGSKLALRIHRILSAGRTPVISPVRLMAITALCAVAILAPAIGELTHAHAGPPILNRKPLTVSSDRNESLSPIHVRVEATPINQSILPNWQQKTPSDLAVVTDEDKALLEKGSNYLKKEQYSEARLAYQTFINTHTMESLSDDVKNRFHFTKNPLHVLELEARFAIADSYYNEGGAQNLIQATMAYGYIFAFFPAYSQTEDAKIKALKTMNRFLNEYPDNDYAPIVHEYKVEVEEHLALADFEVAQFYAEKGNWASAIIRLKRIIDNYLEFSRMDEVKRLYEALTVDPDQFMAPAKPTTFEKGNTPTIEALLTQKKALLEQISPSLHSGIPM
jgi:outer membrane protein assembly factor BamD (BamD/ComL family)